MSGAGVPGSVTFAGPGNLGRAVPVVLTRAQLFAKALKVCRTKRNKHKRGVCEAAARKRYGPVRKAKKAGKAKKSARPARGSGTGWGGR